MNQVFHVLLIVLLVLATVMPVAAQDVKIGYVGGFTGHWAKFGIWHNQGAEVALEEINAKGGVQGRKLVVLKEDDRGEPSKTIAAALKLIERDQVSLAFTGMTSTTMLAALPVYTERQVAFGGFGFAPSITQRGSKYVFRLAANAREQNRVIVDHVVKKVGVKRFAMIGDTTQYGQENANTYVEMLKTYAIEPVAIERFSPGDKDYTGQLTRIRGTNPDALILATTDVDSGLIAKQVRQMGLKWLLMGNTSQATRGAVDSGGIDATNGIVMSALDWVIQQSGETNERFKAAFKAKHGQEPNSYMQYWGYDHFHLFKTVLERAMPNPTPAKVRDAFAAVRGDKAFKGLTGVYDYDDAGEGYHGLRVMRWVNGKLVLVE